METFTIYQKVATPKPSIISIADLIPIGRENAIKRNELLARCVEAQIAFTDRMMRKEIEKAKRDFVILNHSKGKGYYRPSIEDMQDLQRYIRQEEKRAKSTFKNIKRAKALYEDYKHGRVEEG